MVARGEHPYHLKPLSGGRFKDSYGEVDVSQFSIFIIIKNIRDWRMRFAIYVFDCKDGTNDFVIIKDITWQHAEVQKKYYNAKEVVQFITECSYITTEIEFIMPEIPTNGWHVKPVVQPPKISMNKIHAYRAGNTLPNINMILKWEGIEQEREQIVNIVVRGVDFKSFNLPCKAHQSSFKDLPKISTSHRPTLCLLQRFPMQSGETTSLRKLE